MTRMGANVVGFLRTCVCYPLEARDHLLANEKNFIRDYSRPFAGLFREQHFHFDDYDKPLIAMIAHVASSTS